VIADSVDPGRKITIDMIIYEQSPASIHRPLIAPSLQTILSRGIFSTGFFVSPAVIAIDSVPPSTANEWCSRDMPVLAADTMIISIATTVNDNADNDQGYYCDNLDDAEPVLELQK
jgi:hypothetical protein